MFGTVAVTIVGELTMKVAVVAPRSTLTTPTKFEPVIVTCRPACPKEGEKPVICGGLDVTVKELELVAVPPVVVTEIGPELPPTGTVAAMVVEETTVNDVAVVPLNVTPEAPVKLPPVIVTVIPTGPLAGVNESTDGGGTETANGLEVVAVPPGVVTEIGPAVAPAGT